jgi:hypothetical protein
MFVHVLPLVLAMSGQAAPPRQAPPAKAPAQQAQPAAPVQRPATPRKIYNETADAKAALATALKAAAEDDIRVLINWGNNDDPNCAKFQQALYGAGAPEDVAQPLRTKLSNEYKLVTVDVGHLDKNQDLAAQYKPALDLGHLPYLTVLDKKGQVLAHQPASQFASDTDPAAFEPKKILALLAKHQVPPTEAQPLFDAALRKAKAENKEVFLWFSAPW